MDRGLGNGDWRRLFPRVTVRHLVPYASDHASILLDTMGDSDYYPRLFRFEAFWAQDQRSAEVVNRAWRVSLTGSPAYPLCHILRLLRLPYDVGTGMYSGISSKKFADCNLISKLFNSK